MAYACAHGTPTQLKTVMRDVLAEFESTALSRLPELPNSIIQGDMNDANIVVEPSTDVIGVLDFGDMIYSKRVFELAVCMAYLLLRTPKGMSEVETAAAVLKGFSSVSRLNDTELYVVFPPRVGLWRANFRTVHTQFEKRACPRPG